MRELLWTIGIGIALAVPALAHAQASEAAPTPPLDYADRHNWLCFPGKSLDACDVDLTTTIVTADGRTHLEKFRAHPNPPVDCFYVYPTVSKDSGVNAEPVIEGEERAAVRTQFARFGARCRLYAPLYRQHTLTALLAELTGHPLPGEDRARKIAYEDVRDAWRYYLAHENRGRGVVLIGHSQGSAVLVALIKNEIEGQAAQGVLVSAILMGVDLAVPEGGDVGGDLRSVPLCHAPEQTGCAIAYASFRATAPPPSNSVFGRPRRAQPGMRSACVNPAALAGGAGPLRSYLQAVAWQIGDVTVEPPRWAKGVTVTTPFVSVPGLLSAQCARTDEFNYLAISVHPDPGGARTSEITGDVIASGSVRPEWGLHLIDVELAMGNLLDIVAAESRTWATRAPAP